MRRKAAEEGGFRRIVLVSNLHNPAGPLQTSRDQTKTSSASKAYEP
jgi:hypothetical protein